MFDITTNRSNEHFLNQKMVNIPTNTFLLEYQSFLSQIMFDITTNRNNEHFLTKKWSIYIQNVFVEISIIFQSNNVHYL